RVVGQEPADLICGLKEDRFFFLAVDGIRDRTVTGVQTCALPIWMARPKMRYTHQRGANPPLIVIHGNSLGKVPEGYRRYLEHFRSEERRVGKECRSRWGAHKCNTTDATCGVCGRSPHRKLHRPLS